MAHEHRDHVKALKIALVLTTLFLLVECSAAGSYRARLPLSATQDTCFRTCSRSSCRSWRSRLGPAPHKVTDYGFHRAEVFAAFANSVLLIAVSAVILWEAWQRALNPARQGVLMGIVAMAGLISNVGVGTCFMAAAT